MWKHDRQRTKIVLFFAVYSLPIKKFTFPLFSLQSWQHNSTLMRSEFGCYPLVPSIRSRKESEKWWRINSEVMRWTTKNVIKNLECLWMPHWPISSMVANSRVGRPDGLQTVSLSGYARTSPLAKFSIPLPRVTEWQPELSFNHYLLWITAWNMIIVIWACAKVIAGRHADAIDAPNRWFQI